MPVGRVGSTFRRNFQDNFEKKNHFRGGDIRGLLEHFEQNAIRYSAPSTHRDPPNCWRSSRRRRTGISTDVAAPARRTTAARTSRTLESNRTITICSTKWRSTFTTSAICTAVRRMACGTQKGIGPGLRTVWISRFFVNQRFLRRWIELLRNSVRYPQRPVVDVGTDDGFGMLGLELSLLRTLIPT